MVPIHYIRSTGAHLRPPSVAHTLLMTHTHNILNSSLPSALESFHSFLHSLPPSLLPSLPFLYPISPPLHPVLPLWYLVDATHPQTIMFMCICAYIYVCMHTTSLKTIQTLLNTMDPIWWSENISLKNVLTLDSVVWPSGLLLLCLIRLLCVETLLLIIIIKPHYVSVCYSNSKC